jgi:RNA-directed DNA polymerase
MSLKLTSNDQVLAAQFLKIRTPDQLAALLEITPKELGFYLHVAKKYQQFEIRKRSGGTRTISSPANALKIIQRKLNQVLHAVYRGRAPVHGFARGKSIRSNARRHLGCRLLLNLDLKDFFPSIHFGRVKGLFQSKPYSLPERVAVVIAQICCHKRMLPAGAPTSPVVANMVCAQMDSQLKELAKRFGCTYTRYADDISFSTRENRFPPVITCRDPSSNRWCIGDQLRKVIVDNQFSVNDSKTRVCSNRTRLEVTGLTINKRVNVPRKIVRQVRAMLNAWEKYGLGPAQDEFLAKYNLKQRKEAQVDFRKVLRGKLDFIGFIRGRDDDLFLKLLARYAALDPQATIRTITISKEASDAVIAQAVWLIEDANGNQGTAFAAEGYGLLTASHVVEGTEILAYRPAYDVKQYRVNVVSRSEEVDLAQLHIDARIPVQLPLGNPNPLELGDEVTLAGFPRYHVGDSVHINRGPITQKRRYMGVPHYIIQPTIVFGNSGGPVLNRENQVVGIAVKGQGTPGRFSRDDELSSFVPTTMLAELTPKGKGQGLTVEPS